MEQDVIFDMVSSYSANRNVTTFLLISYFSRYNQQCEKNEMVLCRTYQPSQTGLVSKTTYGPRVSPIGDHNIYDKKRRQGRPAKRRRDELDKYWSDTIWQKTAQYRLTWKRHAEAFAQPRDNTAT